MYVATAPVRPKRAAKASWEPAVAVEPQESVFEMTTLRDPIAALLEG
jgi:hypothetical protein